MDPDDLEIMSAALQDAVTKIGDISWESAAGRLTIAFNSAALTSRPRRST